VSPLITDRVLPNEASQRSVPDAPLMVLLLVMNAPLIVAVPLILNVATLAALVILWLDAAAGEYVGRFPLLYER
jgi:hypothetical protein